MEGIFWCLLGFLTLAAVLLGCVAIAAIIGIATGLLGLVSRSRLPGRNNPALLWLLVGLVIVCTAVLATLGLGVWRVDRFFASLTTDQAVYGTSIAEQQFYAGDEQMRPFAAAINAVDRAALGFTPIPPYARVEVKYTVPPASYDVMLHIYAESSRTIALRRQGEGYVWLGEQEIITGPKLYRSADGLFNEEIIISYDTVYISGAPLNTILILYRGDDPRLAGKDNLTLSDIRPVLEEWRASEATPEPTPQSP